MGVIDPKFEVIIMSTGRILIFAGVAWSALVAAALLGRTALASQPLATPEYATWAVLACTPIAIAWMLMRNRSTESIASVLYDAEQMRQPASTTPLTVPRG
jgi:hypothetical protein